MGLTVDWGWGKPGGASLEAAGVETVIRYLTRDTTGKRLTPAEAQDYRDYRIGVVGVFQDSASRAMQGADAGRADATLALQQAREAGYRDIGAIYFAVDFHVDSILKMNGVTAYFSGVRDAIGDIDKIGVYGGKNVLDRVRQLGLARWAWQAAAMSWSGGVVADCEMLQLVEQTVIGGVRMDLNRRFRPIGVWGQPIMSEVSDALNAATAMGFTSFADMFKNTNGGVVDMLRDLVNTVINPGQPGTTLRDMLGKLAAVAADSARAGQAAEILQKLADLAAELAAFATDVGELREGLERVETAVSSLNVGELDYDALARALLRAMAESQPEFPAMQ